MEQTTHIETTIRDTALEIQIQELRAQLSALQVQVSNLIRIAAPSSNPPGDSL